MSNRPDTVFLVVVFTSLACFLATSFFGCLSLSDPPAKKPNTKVNAFINPIKGANATVPKNAPTFLIVGIAGSIKSNTALNAPPSALKKSPAASCMGVKTAENTSPICAKNCLKGPMIGSIALAIPPPAAPPTNAPAA